MFRNNDYELSPRTYSIKSHKRRGNSKLRKFVNIVCGSSLAILIGIIVYVLFRT